MMFRRRRHRKVRSGLSGVQMGLVLAVVGAAALASVQFMGASASGELDTTATGISDPAELVNYWNSKSACGNNTGDAGESSGSGEGGYGDD